MYELMQVGKKTYYINCPAKMGIYVLNGKDICLIDSGNDKHAASKILKIIEEKNWNLQYIINTHSHADHIGGNKFLQQRTNCTIFAPEIELPFVENPVFEPAFLYGAYPCKSLQNKFLKAEASLAQKLCEEKLPQGLEILNIDGHSLAMRAIKTDDDIYFLADIVASEAIIEKYHIIYAYDIAKHIESLEKILNLKAALFIPSHAAPTENIEKLARINLAKIHEIITFVTNACTKPILFDDILKMILDNYSLKLDFNQYLLIGSTIRSYLSYLYDNNTLDVQFIENKLYWKQKD